MRAAIEAESFASLEQWRLAAFNGWQFVRTQVEHPPAFNEYLRRFGLFTKAIKAAEVNDAITKARALEAKVLGMDFKRKGAAVKKEA